MVLSNTNTPLGSFYRRKRAQLGAPKAITATARNLACLIYRLIKNGQRYEEPDLHTYELKYKDQILAPDSQGNFRRLRLLATST
jgi:transposase